MIKKLHLSMALAAVLALAACKPAAPAQPGPLPDAPHGPIAPAPAVGDPGYSPPDGEDGPMECLAYIDLLRAAIRDNKVTGDSAALKAVSDSLRAEAHKGRADAEFDQYYASSVAVFDDLPMHELQRKAAACIAHPPTQPAP